MHQILYYSRQRINTGLEREVCWCNPPWRAIQSWVKKAYEESLRGTTVVMLLPCRTDTPWWHDYIEPYAKIRWIKGRIKLTDRRTRFLSPAPFSSLVPNKSVREARSRGDGKLPLICRRRNGKNEHKKRRQLVGFSKPTHLSISPQFKKRNAVKCLKVRAGKKVPPAQGQRERVCEVKGVEKTTRAPSARHRMHPLVRTVITSKKTYHGDFCFITSFIIGLSYRDV